jgi:1-deoxy-D-xylulose 5-phosphate reductoisomerase
VAAFLEGRLGFTAIPRLIAAVMAAHRPAVVSTLAAIRQVDGWARDYAAARVAEMSGSTAPK